MKTAKEFIEKMQSDKDFTAQVKEKVKAAKDAGAEDTFAAISTVSKELGKVAGGGIPWPRFSNLFTTLC